MYLIISVDFLLWLCCYASPSYVHYKLMISGPQSIERNTIFKFESSSVNNGPLSLEFSTSQIDCFFGDDQHSNDSFPPIFSTLGHLLPPKTGPFLSRFWDPPQSWDTPNFAGCWFPIFFVVSPFYPRERTMTQFGNYQRDKIEDVVI